MRKVAVWIAMPLTLVVAGFSLAAFLGQSQAAGTGPEERRTLLVAVGTFGAAHVHETYLNIGLIADGKAEGMYEAKDAKELLQTVLALREAVSNQLEKIGKLELDPQDRKGLARLQAISTLLAQQGKELEAFWESGNKERGAKYEKARQQAWKKSAA